MFIIVKYEYYYILITVILSTNIVCRSIIERFGVGKATGVRAVRRVAKALCELSPRYITWPTENKIQDIIYNFSRQNGFPNVIGAIDGSHINIPAPTENPEAYVNRKGRHSIHLQVIL